MSFTTADLKNPQGLERARALFSRATFLGHIGVELSDAEVLRAGKRLIFTEARVSAWHGGAPKLVATFSGTLAVVSLRGEG